MRIFINRMSYTQIVDNLSMCKIFGGIYVKKIINLPILFFLGLIFFISISQVQAIEYQDGTYSVNYTVYENGTDSASIANDYFDKPATVIVKNHQAEIQLQMNHSDWITEFNVGNSTQVIQKNDSTNTRIVQFTTTNLDDKVDASIKVDIENSSLNYHHQYKVQLGFDSLPVKSQSDTTSSTSTTDKQIQQDQSIQTDNSTMITTNSIENPKTGLSDSSITYVILSLLAIVAIVGLSVGKKVTTKSK